MSKSGKLDPDELLKDRDLYDHRAVRANGGFLGSLYVARSSVRQPNWLSFFASGTETSNLAVLTASAAAVFLVQVGSHVFALTFGHGRHMLAPGQFDERFGLKVTLNAIDPSGIRSIDRRTFEAIGRHTREQLNTAGQIEMFGMDVERDLLRAVTGRPVNDDFGRWMSGMDSLAVTARITLSNLREHLELYGQLSEDKTYKTKFPWVDNVAEVRDASKKDALNVALQRRLERGDLENVWLAPPKLIDWLDYAGFKYGSAKNAAVYVDLTWEDYISDRSKDPALLTIDVLSRDRVALISSTGDTEVDSWTVFNCICAEMDLQDGTYVLSDGKWYQVDRDFVRVVDSFLHQMPASSIPCDEYNHPEEVQYNRSLAARDTSLLFMDGTLVARGGGRSQIEVCDILSNSGCFFHVKRYRSSASLSHLFAQGLVSAQLLAGDATFRRDVVEILPPTHAFDPDTFQPRNFEVGFGVIGRPGTVLKLPFFSWVNLRNTAIQLGSIGYKVSMTPIRALQ